ncbi:adenine phosphoribosyltransferase [Gilvimarinus sp. DA14]|uniref:adenine phosphoribosyltransferase n=1 Tax=Gilvimarinus sp. DA14 TaxID=2956798 RepID=UPI0020B778B4|nr:adenine phosphoribosyltransferase [Gilvimarinus sp. DA14]UTF60596.1 adenine phosphoribosyltransferase [Gilvimarinus sp. DA14]
MDTLKRAVTTIPDFPRIGVQFRDITSLLEDPLAFALACEQLAEPFADAAIDKVVAIEARGFAFGGAVALSLGAGMVMARKPGKLPREVISQTYQLEYGQDSLNIHADAVQPGERVLIVDDLIATGGTVLAAADLLARLGAKTVAAAFVISLPGLGGVAELQARQIQVHNLLEYEGE